MVHKRHGFNFEPFSSEIPEFVGFKELSGAVQTSQKRGLSVSMNFHLWGQGSKTHRKLVKRRFVKGEIW